MNPDLLSSLALQAVAAVAVVTGLVGSVKRAFPKAPAGVFVALSFVFGVGTVFALSFAGGSFETAGSSIGQLVGRDVMAGVMAALMAMGLYEHNIGADMARTNALEPKGELLEATSLADARGEYFGFAGMAAGNEEDEEE